MRAAPAERLVGGCGMAAVFDDRHQCQFVNRCEHATAARFAPGVNAREAARAMRRDLRAVRRGIRRTLSRSERVRGLLSLQSLGLA